MNRLLNTGSHSHPDSIGPYTVLEEAGRGGFGTVYRAEQTHPVRRQVALKVLKTGMASESGLKRFQIEQQMLATLHHPNIAAIFQSGTTEDGLPYFAMEWVNGSSLTDYCDRARLSARGRLELFLDLCRAVQHAHQKGIIHRDLKPNNVLVSEDEQTRPRVLVIDFGIAKSLESTLEEGATLSLSLSLSLSLEGGLGTPEYMSPEQSRGDLDIDTRSDIYSLGVILYELLTGTTPLRGTGDSVSGSSLETLHRIELAQPPTPSTRLKTLGDKLTVVAQKRATEPGPLRRTVRGELDWIVMKALEKDKGRRYDSASALAADVLSFLRGDPVSAGAPTAFYITRKLIGRHRTWFAAACASLLLMAGGAVFCIAMGKRSTEAAIRAELARKRVEQESKLRLQALDQAESILTHLVTVTGTALELRGRAGVFEAIAERAHAYFSEHVMPEGTPDTRAAAQNAIARSRLLAAWNDDRPDEAARLPGLDQWPVLHASILADTGQYDEAVRVYQSVPDSQAAEAMRDLRIAVLAIDYPSAFPDGTAKLQSHLLEAVPKLQAMLIADPPAAGIRELLAETFAAGGTLATRDAAVFYEWQRAAQDFEDACKHSSYLIDLDAENLRLRQRHFRWALDAADAWLKAGQPESAAKIVPSLPSAAEGSSIAHITRYWELQARIEMARPAYDDAFRAISMALEHPEPDGKPRLLGLLGKIESARGNDEAAADACLQARELWHGHPERLPAEAASILSAANHTSEAIAWLRDAIKFHTATADKTSGTLIATAASHEALAALLDTGSDVPVQEAVDHWRSAMEALERQTGLVPNSIEEEASEEIRQMASRIRKKLDRPEDGQTAVAETKPKDPAATNAIFLKAKALSNAGQDHISEHEAEAELAKAELAKARELFEQLLASNDAAPVPTLWRNEYAFALTRSGRQCRMAKPPRVVEAVAFNSRAVKVRTSVYDETNDAAVLNERTRDYIEWAQSYAAGNELEKGEGILRFCLGELNDALDAQEWPGNAVVVDSVGECHYWIASICKRQKNFKGALEALNASSAARRALHRRAPNKAIWASSLADSLYESAKLADILGRIGQADAAFAEAGDLRGQLARWRKRDIETKSNGLKQNARRHLAEDVADYATLLWEQARHNEVFASISDAENVYQASLSEARQVADFLPKERADVLISQALVGIGGVQLARNQYAEAKVSLLEAESLIPTSSKARMRIHLLTKMGECLFYLGDTPSARARLTEAIALAEEYPAQSMAEVHYLLMRARLSLSVILLESNESVAAADLAEKALQPWPEGTDRNVLWETAANALRQETENNRAPKTVTINN